MANGENLLTKSYGNPDNLMQDTSTFAKNPTMGGALDLGIQKQLSEQDPGEAVRLMGMGEFLKDPYAQQKHQMQGYMNDPRITQLYGQQQDALTGMQGAAEGFNQYAQNWGEGKGGMMDMFGQAARGQSPSLADKYGAVARQQAQGDIAKQAAMSSRGGTDLASRRAAIMGASNVGANMAGQIAAARVGERQQAMQQYLQARQAQAGVMQAGAQGMGQAAGAYNQPMNAAQMGRGGTIAAGQQDQSQHQTIFGNWGEPGGSGQ